jgi:signal-transduction protein with cAMP-binding, CBS, and nucleotidyltransferase domain
VSEAVEVIAAHDIGTALVVDSTGDLVGIISERDLIRALNRVGSSILNFRVRDLMVRPVVTCTPEAPIGDALSLMASHRIRHLPVVRHKEILGLISIRDVLEFRLQEREEHSASLARLVQEYYEKRGPLRRGARFLLQRWLHLPLGAKADAA